ncbi:ATP-dependent zinc metalloprotease FtsH [Patescibacteria group bacterium]|nr:ATP-dependent zinc metalloprotease FtsH [Patescibacteria group bacterium]
MSHFAKIKQTSPRNNFIYVLAIALILTSILIIFRSEKTEIKEIPISNFVQQIKDGKVDKVIVKEDQVSVNIVLKNEEILTTTKEVGQSVQDLLRQEIPAAILKDINITVEKPNDNSFWSNLIISIIPIIFLVGFFAFMLHRAQGSSNQAMSFGKSSARLMDKGTEKTMFKDVAGCLEAKDELIEIVDFLKNPSKYTSMGAKIPKGVLILGPPGTGKTLLARAVSGEAKVPFFNISGSEFVEMFVGVGASRVRDLFKKAKRNAPCIIFIDEIDAVGRQRGAGLGGGNDEREQTLNQILTEMDGFETETNIIVIAATNRPDVLDPALLRPGRFDRRITIDRPDLKDREAVLKVHSRNKPLDKNIDIEKIAKQTPGFSGADLENLMNEAAINAAKDSKKHIYQDHLEKAVEKVMMGPERKSRILSLKERNITAIHEAGHAIVGHILPECDPVHKISIISRGMALGVTWFLPEEDKHLYSKSKFEAELSSLLGGHVAEKLTFGEVTTGASNDLERATDIARKMVTKYGMSNLGPLTFGENKEEIFLGRDLGHIKNYSEKTAQTIDDAIKSIIEDAYKDAEEILVKHKKTLKEIADFLLKKESISNTEFIKFFKTHAKSPKSSSNK